MTAERVSYDSPDISRFMDYRVGEAPGRHPGAALVIAAVSTCFVARANAYLTLADVFPNPSDPVVSGTMSPDGANIYATLLRGVLVVLRRDTTTGSLSLLQLQGGVAGVPGFAGVAVSPDGAHVYASSNSDARVIVFRRDPTTGGVTVGDVLPEGAMLFSPDGRFAYRGSTAGIVTFARDAATGRLARVDIPAVEGGPVLLSPDGTTLYALSLSDPSARGTPTFAILAYARNAGSGALSPVQRLVVDLGYVHGVQIASAVASPDGRSLYFGTYQVAHPLFVFDRANDGTIALVQRAGPFDAQTSAPALLVSPDGGVVYLGGPVVAQRDAATGRVDSTLVELDAGGAPMVQSPDGRDLYVIGTANAVLHYRRRCGDGVVDAGEECDDGGLADGDGCSSACTVEPCWSCTGSPSACAPRDGGPCDDGNSCTSGDVCAAGGCVPGPAVADGVPCDDGDTCTVGDACEHGACVGGDTAPACGPCERCDYDDGCTGVPRLQCASTPTDGRHGSFVMRKTPRRHGFSWVFVGSAPVAATDLPDPRTTPYTFCGFDEVFATGLPGRPPLFPPVLQLVLPTSDTCGSARSCWTPRRGGGFSLQARADADVANAVLRPANADRPSLIVRGRAVPRSLPLVLGGSATVQLWAGASCWSANYSNFIDANTRRRFAAQEGSCPRSGCGGDD